MFQGHFSINSRNTVLYKIKTYTAYECYIPESHFAWGGDVCSKSHIHTIYITVLPHCDGQLHSIVMTKWVTIYSKTIHTILKERIYTVILSTSTLYATNKRLVLYCIMNSTNQL